MQECSAKGLLMYTERSGAALQRALAALGVYPPATSQHYLAAHAPTPPPPHPP
jgi:hypothetical protein